jgi:hypothetical protein
MNLVRALLLPIVLIVGIVIGSTLDKPIVSAVEKPEWVTIISGSFDNPRVIKFNDGNATCYMTRITGTFDCVENNR